MIIEIPEPSVIFNVIVAFLVGLFGLYIYYKLRPLVKFQNADPTYIEKLEYYEKQLIDMKIKIDSLEMQGDDQNKEDPNAELKEFLERLAKNASQEQIKSPSDAHSRPIMHSQHPASSFEPTNTTEQVLHIITNKAMTSRDIQITLNHSREHTSRLMKKLFEGGFVERTTTKPYTYSITQKGREKIKKES